MSDNKSHWASLVAQSLGQAAHEQEATVLLQQLQVQLPAHDPSLHVFPILSLHSFPVSPSVNKGHQCQGKKRIKKRI